MAEGVLITGVYGSGKSSVAVEIAYLLEQRGQPYALLDLDFLGWGGVTFDNHATVPPLMLRNLAAVASNYRDAGFSTFVLAWFVRDHGALRKVREAAGVPLRVVRLSVSLPDIERRLSVDVTTERQDNLREAAASIAAGEGVGVEDSFGGLTLPAWDGMTVHRFPLMIRPPAAVEPLPGPDPGGAVAAGSGAGVRLVRAADREKLAQAERVIVDGFPRLALQPFRPECMLPPLVLTIPGWQTWLAYRDGEPAAACCTFDDGAALGINWLATLPEHRSHGLGRAVMCTALGFCARRAAVLVATEAGRPLYSSLGFQTVTEAAWYRSPGPATGTDGAESRAVR